MGQGRSLTEYLQGLDGVQVRASVPLAPFTTFGTGGPAKFLITVDAASAVAVVLETLQSLKVPWVCLGAGSNVLVADHGFEGAVVKLGRGLEFIRKADEGSCPVGREVSVTVGGAALLPRVANALGRAGMSGFEFACGIPGSMGGAVVTNAGAHGNSMVDVVRSVELATASGVRTLTAGELVWAYRSCSLPETGVVTAVELLLTTASPEELMARQRKLLQLRWASQPRGVRTFGSVFKNPPGQPAGRLLEEAGLKGVRVGGAEVSTVHANFLVNRGHATTSDALDLMRLMQARVLARTGIKLEPEVRLLGQGCCLESDERADT